MTLDFDPFEMPAQLKKWLAGVSEKESAKAQAEFAKRAVTASHVLKAVNELRTALATVNDPRVPPVIRDLLELARDLHDYDPTSD